MIRYLIQRPIAISMTFIALITIGLLLSRKTPVSLLPNVDVPEIVIQVNYPNTSATVLEKNVVQLIRESLVNVGNLQNIESRAANHTGILRLTFDHGTRMNLAYIEVNEKIDRLSNTLPRDMPRPNVIRVNTSDIPVVRLQVIPKEGASYLEVSALAEKVLKRRLEQIDGIAMVDINGRQKGLITLTLDKETLNFLGLSENIVSQTIRNANKQLGAWSIKDGQYKYSVNLFNTLDNEAGIGTLPIRLRNGSVIALSKVANVRQEAEVQNGYHLYNGKEGLVITVQKQPDSRMNDLLPKVQEAVELFKRDYPQVNFALTQDQTFLLDAGISNLKQDLIYASIFTVLLLFLLLGNWASATLISISIPVSLIITFIFFYLFRISFNIISLSGLALGIGMLIDNSIVVIDSITHKRKTGMDMLESSVRGTNEVIAPVISQVLTTVAVYAPLIFLGGVAGSLVFDQALALTISLGVSLMVAFVLAPMLYKMFLKISPAKLKEDTVVYKSVLRAYHKMIDHILKRKLLYLIITVILMPVGVFLASKIPISALPKIENKESLVSIDWNVAIDAQENLRRVKDLQAFIKANCTVTEAEVGIKQFLLQQDNNTIQHAEIYFSCENQDIKLRTDSQIKQWVRAFYSQASINIRNAPNAFTQLFSSSTPYFEVRFRPLRNASNVDAWDKLNLILDEIPNQSFVLGDGFIKETSKSVLLDYTKMAIYGVSKSTVEEALQQQFGVYAVSEIKRFGDIQNIRLRTDRLTMTSKLASNIKGDDGSMYPLSYFISVRNDKQSKFITADKMGEYRSIVFSSKIDDVPTLQRQLSKLAIQQGFSAGFVGQYFESKKQLVQIGIIFFIVVLLLYFILAIQYEDLVQPLIVMATIPLGITGGMFSLWITGGTLDIMAAIGFVVVLGLIVDDPILKLETLNRLEKQYKAEGLRYDNQLLKRMIHEAGNLCLKPLLLVSLTTSLALVPVLFLGGIGNDLQKPLAIVIIGGLTIGTFFTTWFIPLAYWYVTKYKNKC